MMAAGDVVEVLERLQAVGVHVWLDGGWGVDALLGYQSRTHDDLDAVISRQDLARAHAALAPLGYQHAPDVKPGLPARFVLRNPTGRQIDFHPVVFDEAGNGYQDLGDGSWCIYPAEGLAGCGQVAARTVRCIPPRLRARGEGPRRHAPPRPTLRGRAATTVFHSTEIGGYCGWRKNKCQTLAPTS